MGRGRGGEGGRAVERRGMRRHSSPLDAPFDHCDAPLAPSYRYHMTVISHPCASSPDERPPIGGAAPPMTAGPIRGGETVPQVRSADSISRYPAPPHPHPHPTPPFLPPRSGAFGPGQPRPAPGRRRPPRGHGCCRGGCLGRCERYQSRACAPHAHHRAPAPAPASAPAPTPAPTPPLALAPPLPLALVPRAANAAAAPPDAAAVGRCGQARIAHAVSF